MRYIQVPSRSGGILRAALLCVAIPAIITSVNAEPAVSGEYQDFNPGGGAAGSDWIKVIEIAKPELRSEVDGDVAFEFTAPGMTAARALCWKQPDAENKNPAGYDAVVADIKLGADGKGSFVFPASQFPKGPINVRILAHDAGGKKDIREVQLYNKTGVEWNRGIPATPPPAAAGMKLVFSDDFDGPLAISKTGNGAKYGSHKPGGGDFSGWPFSDFEGPGNPFSQVDTYLRIHASKAAGPKGTSGLISSVAMDGTGLYAESPCYFECRFTAQSAPGTWAAFWLLTKNAILKKGTPGDETDIVEAYGGVGAGNPNHPGYSVTTHFWRQNGRDGKPLKNINKRIVMSDVGSKSYWSTTFHTYAVKITDKETTYFLDDIPVLSHPTGELSKREPHFFMINYAIGGISGWKIDLEREGNASDMFVDYVRVYQGQ